MINIESLFVERMVAKTVKALKSNYLDAVSFTDRKKLNNAVLKFLKSKMKVGFGGSVTIREIGRNHGKG